MRRLARHLFTIISALSLLLCVAVCVLWVRSYWVFEGISHEGTGEKEVLLASLNGPFLILSLGRDDVWPGIRGWEWNGVSVDDVEVTSASLAPARGFAGFGYTHWGHRTNRCVMLAIPHWSLVAVFLLVPAARWLARLRARSRRRRHLCPVCGYDLRASPERCPECGLQAKLPAGPFVQ